ncbi:TlpA disulfide reductase family protein [Chitinivorax sp. B]|uniref:TlpA family protein disulfide reductase n=1 Tax=Chitinivorax sp. B TaxID=2502235 RepID=UPI0010F6B6B9|nr:TlpA disulfide reductase family protein [Chitinivorax sp. B]
MPLRKLIVWSAMWLSPIAAAYQVGDTVDSHWMARLNAAPSKTIVVDFFAAWCESCRKEMPLLSRLYNRLDRSRYDIVGVDVDDDPKVAQAFQADMKARGALSFPVVNDAQQEIIGAFKPIGMPALYFIRNGKVVKVLVGAVADIDKVVEQALEAKP